MLRGSFMTSMDRFLGAIYLYSCDDFTVTFLLGLFVFIFDLLPSFRTLLRFALSPLGASSCGTLN